MVSEPSKFDGGRGGVEKRVLFTRYELKHSDEHLLTKIFLTRHNVSRSQKGIDTIVCCRFVSVVYTVYCLVDTVSAILFRIAQCIVDRHTF